mmetsp:Transcript_28179/g.47764  ORF Transcript_28179/g.47764 Transcript_28179/m.47764 type:complete len:154 (-) Transcript_28179:386-847(-)
MKSVYDNDGSGFFIRVAIHIILNCINAATADLSISLPLKALEKKKGMSAYKKGPTMMVLPLGPNGGNSQLPMGIVVGNFLTRTIKSGDLFSSNTWGELNQDIANPQLKKGGLNRRNSLQSLEGALKIDEEKAKKILEEGLGKEKKVEPGQAQT